MARELDININLVDGGATQTAQQVDQALDQTAATAEKAGQSIALLEGKLALAKAQLANTNTEMRLLTAAMADMSGSAQAKLQGELQMTGERMVQARQNVSQLTNELKTATGATDQATNSMSNMDRMAERLVMRMALLQGLRMSAQFIEGLFTSAEATANLATNLDVSTTKVQEWQYAARQTGVGMGALTGAADTLGKKLAGGGDSVSSALQTLGLDTASFFDADPGERFDQTAAAIAQMGDKTDRTGVEMALFGTDKVDPLIMRLNGLEKAAHDAGVVLNDEDTKKLDQASKSMETTATWLKVVAAGWLVAAQNKVAYFATDVSQGHLFTHAPGDESANPDGTLPGLPGSPRNPFMPGQAAPGLDPNKKADLDALLAISRELDTSAQNRIASEKDEAKVLHEIRDIEGGRLSDASALLKMTSNMHAELEASQKAMTELGKQATDEENARKSNLARYGLTADQDGNVMTPEQLNDPTYQANMKMRDLSRQPKTAAGTANRTEEINNDFLDAQMKAAKAADAETQAQTGAAAAAVQLSSAHAGAVQAVDSTVRALATFQGVLAGTPTKTSTADMARNAPLSVNNIGMFTSDGVGMAMGSSAGQAGPQWTAAGVAAGFGSMPHFAEGGYAASPMHAVVGDSPGGEYMVPAQKMNQLLTGGGVSIGDIHIHGDVNNRASADRVAQQTADLVFQKMRGQRKVQLGKA